MPNRTVVVVACGLIGFLAAPFAAVAADLSAPRYAEPKPRKVIERKATPRSVYRAPRSGVVVTDAGIFVPYRTRLYPYYAEPFPYGFWWW